MSKTNQTTIQKSQASIRIEGMHCASCVNTIEKALLNEEGVISATVNLLDEKAVVEYEPKKIDRVDLEEPIESTGYKPVRAKMTITLSPEPKQNQWDLIQEKVSQIDGVINTTPFVDRGRLLVEYDESLVTFKTVKRALKEINFDVGQHDITGVDREASAREAEIRYYSRLLAFSLVLSIPVLILTLVPQVLDYFNKLSSILFFLVGIRFSSIGYFLLFVISEPTD